MEIIATGLQGPLILKPRVFNDRRGYFFESYSKRQLDEALGREIDFVQDNESASVRGVIRGLHFQRPPFTQAKLVRCISGAVVDVAVDIRLGSPTYGRYVAVELSGENHLQFFVPRGFAHGFAVMSDYAVFQYKCDNYYSAESDGGIDLADPELAIEWPFALEEAILSEKDTRHPRLKEFDSPFIYGEY